MTYFVDNNHRLGGTDHVEFLLSPNIGGALNPVAFVEHYTAGYNANSAIQTFLNPASKVSAHLVIGRDGKVTQMVPFNRVGWHAGPSRYQGWNGLNQFAIGIEHVNIGYVKLNHDGTYTDPYGKPFHPDAGQKLIPGKQPRIGPDTYYWPTYSDEQIAVSLEVQQAIIAHYPGIKTVVTHEEIDLRGWKTDTGIAFPIDAFKALVRNEKNDGVLTHGDAAAATYTVNASSLNVRSGAGPQWDKFTELLRGTTVSVIEHVGDWSYISFDDDHVTATPDRNGWVATQYLTRS